MTRAARTLIVFLTLTIIGSSVALRAHDVPEKMTIQAFIKPEGQRLHVVLRVPLILLMDLNLPKWGPGYLDLDRIATALDEAEAATAADLQLFEEGSPLKFAAAESLVSLPSNKAFAEYQTALAHVRGPRLTNETTVFWNQGFFDVHLEYPITSDRSRFEAQIAFAPSLGERVETIVRFITPEGAVRPYQFVGATDRFAFDPRWHQAAWLFVKSGFRHILGGVDHLLFLACLVIPIRRVRTLLLVITAFTLAHSVTLIAAASGVAPSGAWFPPLVETLIAASIVYMALENIIAPNARLRWILSFAFGLVHGFGFSFALRESLQFAGPHLLLSLLSFNVGVEFGQAAVLLALVPALAVLFQRVAHERAVTIVLSALVAHTGWHWMVERWAVLGAIEWPTADVVLLAAVARWAFVVLAVGGVGWLAVERLVKVRLKPDSTTVADGSR